MRHLLYYDIKRNFPIRRIILTIFVAWLTIFFFSHFFANDMTEDRLLEKLSIGIVDEDQSKLSSMLLDNFKKNKQFSSMMDLQISDSKKLNKKFQNGELTAVVTIPKGFTQGLMYYQNLPLSVMISDAQPLKAMILTEVLDSYSDYIQSVDSATLAAYEILAETDISKERLKNHNDLFSIKMVTFALNRNKFFSYKKIDTFPSTNSFVYFISAILCLAICFLSTGVIFAVYDDLKSFTLHRHKMYSTNFRTYIASKVISFSVVITLICILIFTPLTLKISISFLSILIVIAELFIFSMLYISIFIFIGLVLFSETSASLFCNLFIFLLGLLGGNFIPLSLMPKTIQNISAFTINYHVIRNLLLTISNLYSNHINITFIILSLMSVAILFETSCRILMFRIQKGSGELCEIN